MAASDELPWGAVEPSHGDEKYVSALRECGMALAQSVPEQILKDAITPLSEEPTCDLFPGVSHKAVRERNLHLERKNESPHLWRGATVPC